MMASHGFDDEELTISLSSSQLRRDPPPTTPALIDQTAHAPARLFPPGGPPPPPTITTTAPAGGDDYDRRTDSPGGAKVKPALREKIKAEQRIGIYRVIKTLGEGSFGKVKLAVHNGTGQQVALKIIARKKLISRDMAGRVEREIEYLQLLRHPHIIKLYHVIKTPFDIIMVLEYAGKELFDYIVSTGRMKEDQARRFFQQMICAVEYCHRHKIVHRDLKPENLLLDEDLNVKIADFGLSNIMTDGNFLKTSCGSPNYAAPEVIGGKLYAGPEVDVWSCGVILYVLLIGRLPFDDEHIPSLFAKIARGTYSIPSWMPSGAAVLIKKMLVVNPLHRATIEDIRADPWFAIDLPPYLAPTVDDFFNTGVDFTKAIRKTDIAPNASPREQERIFSKLTKEVSVSLQMSKQDVAEALALDEPSMVKDTLSLVYDNNNLKDPKAPAESLSPKSDSTASPMPSLSSSRSVVSSITTMPPRPYVSKIGVLPSSLPAYHKDYVERKKAGLLQVSPTLPQPTTIDVSEEPRPALTEAERGEVSRRLKPHSRSQIRLDEQNKRLSSLTPAEAPSPAKRVKPVRWQFGIRSRNAPWEALLCIYKALYKLGATYLPDEDYERLSRPDVDVPSSVEGSFIDPSGSYSGAPLQRTDESGSAASIDPLQKYKLPGDPWHVKVRWETKALQRSTTLLPLNDVLTDPSSYYVHQKSVDQEPKADFLALHMDIQIYEMESGVYLVDFKCSGYETADRRLLDDKEVSSPFPFLDMAAKLIMQLAETD